MSTEALEKNIDKLVDAVCDGFDESNFRMIQFRSILVSMKQDLQSKLLDMKEDVRIIKRVIHLLLEQQGLYELLTIEEAERLKKQGEGITSFISEDETDLDTVTTVWKSPFVSPNGKEEEEDKVVGSRVLDLEAITDDETMLSTLESEESPRKVKKQKLMNDFFNSK